MSGLPFYDKTKEVHWRSRYGQPYFTFGMLFAENSRPLAFQYPSTDSIVSFDIVKITPQWDVVEIASLPASLVAIVDGNHKCSGTVDYPSSLENGWYYFVVNDKYESVPFQVLELDDTSGYLELYLSDYLELYSGGGLEIYD